MAYTAATTHAVIDRAGAKPNFVGGNSRPHASTAPCRNHASATHPRAAAGDRWLARKAGHAYAQAAKTDNAKLVEDALAKIMCTV
jgi:hypothetical protein